MKPMMKFQNHCSRLALLRLTTVYDTTTYVASSRESNALGATGQRKDFSNDYPGCWSPGGREEEDVETGEDDQPCTSGLAAFIDCADNGNDELADEHANGTSDKKHVL